MTTVPNRKCDTRLRYWEKILQKYQNQTFADGRNNLKLSEPLRRVQVKVLRAMAQQQGTQFDKMTLRRLEATMVRAVSKS